MAGSKRGERTGGDLRLESLTKRFGSFVAVDDIDLVIPQGSFFALLGPSGCGKTTTLRMVAGLEAPTQGRILIGDEDITYAKPYKRNVNTVFQSYALFPHLDIFENVAFGLRRRGQKDVRKRVDEALDLIELGHLAKRKPAQLSGGQQQRVALARAIVNRPEVLLLDEPLGALDLKLRRQMQIELKRIQTEVGITFVHVTHDQEEAMTMADTIAVMNAGRIEQMADPVSLYESPVSAYVANFLGQSNLVPARVARREGENLLVQVGSTTLSMRSARSHATGEDLMVGVRPEKIRIARESEAADSGLNVLTGGTVADASFTGVSTQYLVDMPFGNQVMVFAQNSGADVLPVGERVSLAWLPEHTFALDRDAASEGSAPPEADGASDSSTVTVG